MEVSLCHPFPGSRHQDITAQRSKRTRKELIRGTVWGLSGMNYSRSDPEPKPFHFVSSIKQVVDLNFLMVKTNIYQCLYQCHTILLKHEEVVE